MNLEGETRCLRTLQEADLEALQKHLNGGPGEIIEGIIPYSFEVEFQGEEGNLSFDVDEENGEILKAHMDVNFPAPIGLNRSPLELRILCEHIRDIWA